MAGLGELGHDIITHFAHVFEFLQFGEIKPDLEMFFDRQHQFDVVQRVQAFEFAGGRFIFLLV